MKAKWAESAVPQLSYLGSHSCVHKGSGRMVHSHPWSPFLIPLKPTRLGSVEWPWIWHHISHRNIIMRCITSRTRMIGYVCGLWCDRPTQRARPTASLCVCWPLSAQSRVRSILNRPSWKPAKDVRVCVCACACMCVCWDAIYECKYIYR